jgi:sugar-specific transcriptional regulator TrmB
MAVDLLQQAGLNKYEAEAYVALLADGPLTGYELGKRSGVPLSKSYETLERLTRRGLALVQPGDPPRYTAEQPERFLARTRADRESVLSALGVALADIRGADPADELWVVRGRANVLARAASLIGEAYDEVTVGWSGPATDLAPALDAARARGCRVSVSVLDAPSVREPAPELLAVLVDGREALAGTLTPPAHCQAVVSANPGLVAALAGAATQTAPRRELAGVAADRTADAGARRDADWLSWENRKHERLRRLAAGGRVA